MYAPHHSIALTPSQRILKAALLLCPRPIKASLCDAFVYLYSSYRQFVGRPYVSSVYVLPCKVALKKLNSSTRENEPAALRFANSLHGVCSPCYIDEITSSKARYLLSTWIEGDNVLDIADDLTLEDKDHLVEDLRSQIAAMQNQTRTDDHVISNASGLPFFDGRIPWLCYHNRRTFTCHRDFAAQVWTDLALKANKDTLRLLMLPFIERDKVPITFCHGDIGIHNVILPGGLEEWRARRTSACLIDWDFGGWMPEYWDAIKAIFLVGDKDDEWFEIWKRVFPEHAKLLDADWEWRIQSGVTTV